MTERALPMNIIPPAEKPDVQQRWRGNPIIKSIIENDPIIEKIITYNINVTLKLSMVVNPKIRFKLSVA